VAAVVLLAIEHAAPLLSPAYWRVADETAVREFWRSRREALDRDFEAHLARVGPVRIDASTANGGSRPEPMVPPAAWRACERQGL
jgi:hypothetical protein